MAQYHGENGKHQHKERGTSNTRTTDGQLAASQEMGTRRFLWGGLRGQGGSRSAPLRMGILGGASKRRAIGGRPPPEQTWSLRFMVFPYLDKNKSKPGGGGVSKGWMGTAEGAPHPTPTITTDT